MLQKFEKISLPNKNIALLLLFLNVVTSASVSIYIPSLKQMASDLHSTNTMIQMTIVAHLIGEFIGRILGAPLIDVYGNRKIIIPALCLSILGHFGCMVGSNFAIFSYMRFTQAMGASVIYVVSLNIINSRFKEKEKAGVVGILELYQPLAWIVSPFVGALLSELGNWRLSFFVLLCCNLIGLLFFLGYQDQAHKRKIFSISDLCHDYMLLLKDSAFTIYALIPGLFAGGYMIFATSCSIICTKFFGDSPTDIAIFSGVPLIAYVASTFFYRQTIRNFGTTIAKRIGIVIYVVFALFFIYFVLRHTAWEPGVLLILMCLQCSGSAFIVPISVFKALQSASHVASIGASTVVVFRNIIMSFCISASAHFQGNITTIMACISMTVATALFLIMTRKIIRTRKKRRLKN